MAQYRRDLFRLIEAALVGLFFVQAIRFLYGTMYAHLSSVALVNVTANPLTLSGQPGVVDPIDVQVELLVLGGALFAPLLSILLGRLWFGATVAAILVAVGRVFMTANGGTTFGVLGGALVAGAAGLYMTILAVRRPYLMPATFILGFAGDQLVRLYGNTMDLTWNATFLEAQTALSIGLFIVAVLAVIFERLTPLTHEGEAPLKGEINGWGAFALGGLLFLEFVVLGLPNTIAHRAALDYAQVAPWVVGVTLLPLVAQVRATARNFLGMFDGRYRGWVWYLTIALLLVIGFRFSGAVAAGMLIAAQFMISLSFWWVVQPSDGRRNFSALGMIFGILFFLLLTGGDFLTYEYAFVRGVQEPFGTLLRAFRGLGLAVALLAGLLACLPAILARKRLPWRGGSFSETLAGLLLVVLGGALGAAFAQPILLIAPASPDSLRVATLNLHGGYSLYFGSDLPRVAQQIRDNGVDVLLLQEVETGRLVSFGVDQPAWLARQLNMQVSYYPTNEAAQGFAVLSRLSAELEGGALLTSLNKQTGVQFVRLRTQNGSALDVYNTQLTLIFRGSGLSIPAQEENQNQQVLEILEYLEQNGSSDRPIIFGGSFNSAPGAEIYTFLQQREFVDPFSDFPTERAVTLRLVNDPPVRVDYVWLRRVVPKFVGVAQVIESNHNMPVVEIQTP